MKDTDLASGRQTSQQKPLVSIYWDLQNVYLSQKQANLLLTFANAKGHLIYTKVYYNSLCKSQSAIKDAISRLGFNCFDVPCPLKNSADNQLKADGIDDVFSHPSPDIVILVSGDGDFAKWVCNLQKLGKKVIIFAQRGNVKQRLVELVNDDFHFVDKLPELIGEKRQPHTEYVLFQFHYHEAIECLIEAIKTALSEGKRTDFSYIGKLMRRSPRFPNCKKFPCVCKPDGTNVSRLGKFIAAAVADGKIRMQNQELFLIEEDGLAP